MVSATTGTVLQLLTNIATAVRPAGQAGDRVGGAHRRGCPPPVCGHLPALHALRLGLPGTCRGQLSKDPHKKNKFKK
jgi:hypothetical protein